MKKTYIFFVIFFVGLLSVNLKADYLDVGSDPEKIKIVSTKEISTPTGYKFKAWSPDGEYFSLTNEPGLDDIDDNADIKPHFVYKTNIYSKNGQLFKQFNEQFKLWSPNSKDIITIDKDKKIEIVNILNNQRKKVEIELNGISDSLNCFNQENNNLVYNKERSIYEYNFDTKKSKLIYLIHITKPIPDFVKLINKNTLLYHLYYLKNDTLIVKYNLTTNISKKIAQGRIAKIYYYNTKLNRIIIVFSIESYIYFCDINGNTIFKLKNVIGAGLPDEEGYTEYFNIEYSSLAPNGKLFAITNGKFTEKVDEFISGDIFIINLKGKSEKITNTENKIELVQGWSPQGDKLIYYEGKSKKHFIMNLTRKN